MFNSLFSTITETLIKIRKNFGKRNSTKIVQKKIKILQKRIKKWMRANSRLMEKVQLTALYSQALLSAIFATMSFARTAPWIITTFFPGILPIFEIPLVQFLLTPEKTYVLFFILVNYMINPKITPFSFFVRYNFFLVFSLEMIYSATMMWSDLLLVDRTTSSIGDFYTPTALLIFYNFLFASLFFTYAYSYIHALIRKIPVFPGILNGIPVSAAFWIRSRKVEE